ncbi:MAG: nuclear transport factor 2 family protein [Thermodesulfobacteriota bacterium]
MLGGALLLASATVTEASMVEGRTTVQDRNKETVGAAFARWRDGTGNVFDLLAPDAQWTIVGSSPVSRTYATKQDFLDAVIVPFNARMAQRLVPSVRALYADGDMVIALFDAEGTARDGKPYRNTYTWYLEMRDDRIVRAIAFFDTIELTDLWTRVAPAAPAP